MDDKARSGMLARRYQILKLPENQVGIRSSEEIAKIPEAWSGDVSDLVEAVDEADAAGETEEAIDEG